MEKGGSHHGAMLKTEIRIDSFSGRAAGRFLFIFRVNGSLPLFGNFHNSICRSCLNLYYNAIHHSFRTVRNILYLLFESFGKK